VIFWCFGQVLPACRLSRSCLPLFIVLDFIQFVRVNILYNSSLPQNCMQTSQRGLHAPPRMWAGTS
jgi:hypothetical protein